ncbi:MAG TPA: galactose-1-phosphate uridylyltransferase [Streptosporangiaceae bacterium]|jgi:UDPglucose--hexose-1-phosphate uridylyltransferase
MTAEDAAPRPDGGAAAAPKKASTTLADGRELIYFGDSADWAAGYPDLRDLGAIHASSQVRYDPLLGEWVIIASHRQDRTFLPPPDHCPLDPSAPGRLTEIPAPSYEVAVFENRFPSLFTGAGGVDQPGLLATRPGHGRCEVVCFSPDHAASFASLTHDQAALVLAAWIDRTVALAARPEVEQVFCFENRGQEIGVTLSHPHGQIYAYPFVTPRTTRMLAMAGQYQRDTGRNLFDDVLAAELADGSRTVIAGEHWAAFVPHAAHWPYEVHLYPRRRVPDLPSLTAAEQSEFCDIYLDLLRRFDRLFDTPAPYISGWHQAPVRAGRPGFALHLELFTIRRAPGKLKYLAGSESGMGAFANDIRPETAAATLRELEAG